MKGFTLCPLAVLASASILFGTICVTPAGSASAEEKPKIYSHDAKGLEKQFAPYLKAVGKGDEAKSKESFTTFAMPNPDAWFAQYFAKDQVQQLVWDMESEVEGYRTSNEMFMRRFLRGTSYSVECKLSPATTSDLKPRADAISPLTPVPVEAYHIKFVADNGHSGEQLANFVYVDGAFRYVGKGAYPFWSMPDATRKPSQ